MTLPLVEVQLQHTVPISVQNVDFDYNTIRDYLGYEFIIWKCIVMVLDYPESSQEMGWILSSTWASILFNSFIQFFAIFDDFLTFRTPQLHIKKLSYAYMAKIKTTILDQGPNHVQVNCGWKTIVKILHTILLNSRLKVNCKVNFGPRAIEFWLLEN